MSEETAKYITKTDILTADDKEYIENGGVIIRTKGELQIECATQSKPDWHLHAGCGEFEDKQSRDKFFMQLLEFADYKKINK